MKKKILGLDIGVEQENSMSVSPNAIRDNEHREETVNSQWHWQEPGTAWKGVGIYHVTITVTDRRPLLGSLVIPENDPEKAWVKRTDLGEKIVDCLWTVPKFHPDVRIVSFDLMPNHLHTIWRVIRPMPTGIKSVVRGFWQAAKQIGRENSMSVSPNAIRDNEHRPLDPIFREMPHIRPLSRSGQLDTMIHYTWHNPQRLATMQLTPKLFRVQDGIEISGRTYKGVGSADLLQRARYMPVHVRHELLNLAKAGNDQPLRDYMNSCVLEARKGTVMVSPFISEYEQMVMMELLKEGLPFIYIADNGFRDYYKPQDSLFDAVADKRCLILSPWEYDPKKKRVLRAECVEMNKMAEHICRLDTPPVPSRG